MIRSSGACAILIGCAPFAQACHAQQVRIPLGTDTYYLGNVSDRTRFGVSIGDETTAAARSAKATYISQVYCNYEINYLAGCDKREIFLFFDISEPSRKGELYLRVRGGKVAAIIWRSAAGRVEF